MKIFNIDTLTITGQGTLTITEGEDNTPIPVYEGVYISHNIAKVIEFLETPVKSVKGLPGEIKRIIMLIHLLKRQKSTNTLFDLLFTRDFKKNAYTTFYSKTVSFKILLSASKNMFVVKEVRIDKTTKMLHECDVYIKDLAEVTKSMESMICTSNEELKAAINNY